jgi:hypothetical protein
MRKEVTAMRYEKPELALLGEADAIVLGGEPASPVETVDSKIPSDLVGYDE